LGDALGIGYRIIRRRGTTGNALQVTAAHAVSALRIGATIGDAAFAHGAADGLLADPRFSGGPVYRARR